MRKSVPNSYFEAKGGQLKLAPPSTLGGAQFKQQMNVTAPIKKIWKLPQQTGGISTSIIRGQFCAYHR